MRRTDPDRNPGSACGGLDPEAFEGLSQLSRVFQRAAVVVPARGRPDLRVIAGPDDDGLPRQARPLAKVGRDDDPALAIELGLERPGEDVALEEAGSGVGDRQAGDL